MPELSLDDIKKKSSQPLTIEGEARDLTGREDIDDDTAWLASEPEFRQETHEDKVAAKDPLAELAKSLTIGNARSLVGKTIHSKVDLIRHLTAGLHMNEYGLPDFVYRADYLDAHEISEQLATHGHTTTTPTSPPDQRGETMSGMAYVNAQIENARVPLTYYEGFPALPNGNPFWQQLEFESKDAHDAFVFYLELDGARKLTDLVAYDQGNLQAWFHLYFWDFRVKAFDLYRVADATRRKLRRMVSTEAKHFRAAEKLFAQLDLAIDSGDFKEKLAALEPDKLIKVLDSVVKIQRISVGLPAQGGTIPENKPVAQSTTVNIMNTIASNDGPTIEEESVDVLSENPEMLDRIQDMLIDVQTKRGFAE